MISRIRMRKSGLADYLKSGHREDSIYNRQEKDNVIVLYGNLEHLKQAEIYTNKHKKWNYNYEHITISFSKEDMKRLDTLNKENRLKALNNIALDMIKHRTSGYDLDSEVIAYAEVHQPKIKREFGKDRLEHIHIGISYLNPLNDTKLRTTFYNNSYISDTIDKYIALKHNLTFANNTTKIKDLAKTDLGRYRKQLQEDLKDINSREELLQYFKDNNINYREVKTKNNHYFKVINKGMKDINLRGRGFEHISNIVRGKHLEDLKNKKLEDLEKILSTYYKKRIEDIDKRRSKKTKEDIKKIYQEDTKENECSIYASYQEKIFYKHYGHLIKSDLKGYSVNINDNANARFINKAKNINVVDKGNSIVSYINDKENLQERVRLMLNIAEAKGWKINNLNISGNKAFIEEAQKQIAERIRLREDLKKQKKKTLSYTEAEAVIKEVEKRPTTATQQYKRNEVEKQEEKKADKDISLTLLKKTLKAENVLSYAVDKYQLNRSDYELTEDNKINNINNKQKPKNVIDFLQKEIHLTTKEAIAICKELYKEQPLDICSSKIKDKGKNKNAIKFKQQKRANNSRTRQRVYKRFNREFGRRKQTANRNNMRVLSESDLVHNKRRIEMLLQSDELNQLDSRNGLYNQVRWTDNSNARNATTRARELEMSLKLSICKDTNVNALNKWEQVEISNYSELASYMKQYPYSATQFEKGYRNSENAKSFNNVLIYDIDNDKDTPQLTINEAEQLLKQHNISAMILPSKSNNIEKNGYKAERYRIVIPTNKAININDKETYREFQRITSRALKIDKFVDKKALNDKARFYYKSPIQAEPTVIKSNRVMNIDNLEKRAIENIQEQKRVGEAEQQRINQIRRNIQQYKSFNKEPSNNLTYANIDKIMQLNINDLINHFERDNKHYKEGSYEMIKTANAKYSIIENNVAHDFKSDTTYNSLTYLQYQINTTNLNKVARELEKITDDKFIEVNYPKVKEAATEAREKATNDKTFEQSLKESFNVKYAKLNKDSIVIADTEIKLTDIDMSKQDIIKDLQSNRELQKQQEETQTYEHEILL